MECSDGKKEGEVERRNAKIMISKSRNPALAAHFQQAWQPFKAFHRHCFHYVALNQSKPDEMEQKKHEQWTFVMLVARSTWITWDESEKTTAQATRAMNSNKQTKKLSSKAKKRAKISNWKPVKPAMCLLHLWSRRNRLVLHNLPKHECLIQSHASKRHGKAKVSLDSSRADTELIEPWNLHFHVNRSTKRLHIHFRVYFLFVSVSGVHF